MSGKEWKPEDTEALMSTLAAVAVSMIRSDPVLIERYRETLAEEKCPLKPEEITEGVLNALYLALTLRAGNDMARGGHGHPLEGILGSVTIPIPRIGDGAAKSAVVLGLGSFLAEYMHDNPAEGARFTHWLNNKHPGTTHRDFSPAEYRTADQLLTMMAHVSSQIAEGGEPDGGGDTVDLPDEAKGWQRI